MEGVVAEIAPGFIAIDCHGVCYALAVPSGTLSKAIQGQKLKLYTYLHVREGVMDLYGFSTADEKKFFLLLLDITGVGPKASLALLSCASTDSLAIAIVNGDEKLLTRAQGVGKKLAQRIILELRDKIAKELTKDSMSGEAENSLSELYQGSRASAVSALMVLGYSSTEARSAVGSVTKEIVATEEIIRAALKNM